MTAFAAALADPALPVPDGLAVPAGVDPARRLAVHRNNRAAGLIDVLRAGFPVTERLVGPDFFAAMAAAFVAEHRPASPVLLDYGADFPAFVAGFAPAASLPYLGDVAAVERARTEACHAADARVLDPAGLAERLADRGVDAVLTARVIPHPAARLVAGRHPAASIWSVHQDAAAPRFDGPWRPETALVTRPGDRVLVRALDAGGGRFAAALLAGAGVAEAGAAALRENPAFDAGAALIELAEAGALGELEV